MMNYSIDTAINNYIGKIETIAAGERNNTLYRIALSLRTKFGYTGSELERVLSKINEMKCAKPLPQCEIKAIRWVSAW
jgi:hypothetical protein